MRERERKERDREEINIAHAITAAYLKPWFALAVCFLSLFLSFLSSPPPSVLLSFFTFLFFLLYSSSFFFLFFLFFLLFRGKFFSALSNTTAIFPSMPMAETLLPHCGSWSFMSSCPLVSPQLWTPQLWYPFYARLPTCAWTSCMLLVQ